MAQGTQQSLPATAAMSTWVPLPCPWAPANLPPGVLCVSCWELGCLCPVPVPVSPSQSVPWPQGVSCLLLPRGEGGQSLQVMTPHCAPGHAEGGWLLASTSALCDYSGPSWEMFGVGRPASRASPGPESVNDAQGCVWGVG